MNIWKESLLNDLLPPFVAWAGGFTAGIVIGYVIWKDDPIKVDPPSAPITVTTPILQ